MKTEAEAGLGALQQLQLGPTYPCRLVVIGGAICSLGEGGRCCPPNLPSFVRGHSTLEFVESSRDDCLCMSHLRVFIGKTYKYALLTGKSLTSKNGFWVCAPPSPYKYVPEARRGGVKCQARRYLLRCQDQLQRRTPEERILYVSPCSHAAINGK